MSKEKRETAKAEEPDTSLGVHHGLAPEQIQKIEDARHDDTEGVPPPELPPVEEPPPDAKAKAKAEKESQDEAEKKRGVKHG